MLINCVAYAEGLRQADFELDELPSRQRRDGEFVWVALRDASAAELQQLQQAFELPELAVEDARHGHQRPKLEEYGDTLFAVLHLIEKEQGELRVGEVHVFVGPDFVVSIRNRSSQHFLGVRERCEREPQLLRHGPGYVFYALMDAVVDRYFPLLDALEGELEEIEGQIFTPGAARWNIERLYALKRRANVLRHAVAPLLEVSSKLHGGRVPAVCQQTQDYFRDVHDHLARIQAAVESMRDTIATAIQVNLSMVTIEESETTKRLAAWAAIFAVSTALAGIWGMNFEHMPELKWRYGYPLALAAIAGAAGLLYWRFKRARWL
ncbi:MAG: magnesium and cobalt transport protein CorA [Inhella sp.]